MKKSKRPFKKALIFSEASFRSESILTGNVRRDTKLFTLIWEIDENLAGSSLTDEERRYHIAERLKLVLQRDKEVEKEVSGHFDRKPPSRTRPKVAVPLDQHKKSGRPKGGVSEAAREVGVSRTTARRALKAPSEPIKVSDVKTRAIRKDAGQPKPKKDFEDLLVEHSKRVL